MRTRIGKLAGRSVLPPASSLREMEASQEAASVFFPNTHGKRSRRILDGAYQ
jgi:hypothetical protein